MKEFIIEDNVENILDLIGTPRAQECFTVTNAELGTTYSSGVALSSYPKLSSPSNREVVREKLLKEAFIKGVRKVL